MGAQLCFILQSSAPLFINPDYYPHFYLQLQESCFLYLLMRLLFPSSMIPIMNHFLKLNSNLILAFMTLVTTLLILYAHHQVYLLLILAFDFLQYFKIQDYYSFLNFIPIKYPLLFHSSHSLQVILLSTIDYLLIYYHLFKYYWYQLLLLFLLNEVVHLLIHHL